MKMWEKCALAVLILIMGAGLSVAASRLEPAASAPYSIFQTSTIITGTTDVAISAVPVFLQCIILTQNDAAPTAGTVAIHDHATANTGTKVFTHTFTTAVFSPIQICPQRYMTLGIWVDWTTTDDVALTVSYR